MSAEIGFGPADVFYCEWASMGPRSDERGNIQKFQMDVATGSASFNGAALR